MLVVGGMTKNFYHFFFFNIVTVYDGFVFFPHAYLGVNCSNLSLNHQKMWLTGLALPILLS